MIRVRQNVQVPAASAPLMLGPLFGLRIRRRDAFSGTTIVVECQGLSGQVLDTITLVPEDDGWITFAEGLRRVRIYAATSPAGGVTGTPTVDLYWSTEPIDAVDQRSARDVPTQLSGADEAVPGSGFVLSSGTGTQQVPCSQVSAWIMNPDPAIARTFTIGGYNAAGLVHWLISDPATLTIPAGAAAWLMFGPGAAAFSPLPAGHKSFAFPLVVPGRLEVTLAAVGGVVNGALSMMWGRQ